MTFFSRRESDRQARLHLVEIHGKGEITINQNGSAVYGEMPSWLPNGKIVYRTTFPEIGIGVVNDDGSGIDMLLADGDASAPSASPDGQFIAFMSRRDGNWEVYRMAADGSDLTRLTETPANDGLPVWSPAGSAIAFASNRDGQWAIWAMNADGSNQRQLFALPGSLDGYVAGEPEYDTRGLGGRAHLLESVKLLAPASDEQPDQPQDHNDGYAAHADEQPVGRAFLHIEGECGFSRAFVALHLHAYLPETGGGEIEIGFVKDGRQSAFVAGDGADPFSTSRAGLDLDGWLGHGVARFGQGQRQGDVHLAHLRRLRVRPGRESIGADRLVGQLRFTAAMRQQVLAGRKQQPEKQN